MTLNRDDQNGGPGTETITITKIRSGIYRYIVHDSTNRGTSSSTKLATSGASVKVYYNDNTTTDSSGDFSKSLNSLGIYALTYSKSGYLGATQSGTLATDNQTLVVGTLSQLAEGCLAGTVSGTITDAVSGNTVSGVSLSVRS